MAGPLSAPANRMAPVDVVRARVTASIALGLISPGERLPDPQTLASSLDVSAITVRRALESLCRDGLLERRRGRTGGTFVKADLDPNRLEKAGIRQVADADVDVTADRRLVVECGVLALVAAASPGREALTAVLAPSPRQQEAGGVAATAIAETSFHSRLAVLTGLAEAVRQVHEAIADSAAQLATPDRVPIADITRDHEAIIGALVHGDHHRALHLLRSHLNRLHHPDLAMEPLEVGDPADAANLPAAGRPYSSPAI